MNTAAEKKQERERHVFQKFIRTSKLPIFPESVESRLHPEPDILCLDAEEGHIAFELTEICAEELARKLSAIDKEEFGQICSAYSHCATLRLYQTGRLRQQQRMAVQGVVIGHSETRAPTARERRKRSLLSPRSAANVRSGPAVRDLKIDH
jgi:hypothetical protein